MTSIRLKIEESWYASMDCKVQKSGPWVCFYGGHSTGYKLGNHPKNIEPCAHRARTVRAPCAHRATTPPMSRNVTHRLCHVKPETFAIGDIFINANHCGFLAVSLGSSPWQVQCGDPRPVPCARVGILCVPSWCTSFAACLLPRSHFSHAAPRLVSNRQVTLGVIFLDLVGNVLLLPFIVGAAKAPWYHYPFRRFLPPEEFDRDPTDEERKRKLYAVMAAEVSLPCQKGNECLRRVFVPAYRFIIKRCLKQIDAF